MYKCLIIDDEQHAIDGLTKYIASTPQLLIVNTYSDPVVALKEILENDSVDLILLDIDMPKISGLELSKEVRAKTDKLIFTTAHSKYAFEAFEVQADAYLLKPYSLGKFIITINRLFPDHQPKVKQAADDFFFVKSKEEDLKITKIKYADIVAVESKQNYVMIHTHSKQILTYMSLTKIAKLLQDIPGFVQLHRSFIVKLEEIENVNGNLVKLTNGIQITVGENFRKAFNAFINNKLIKAEKKV
jgi:DNA-binding LytR/AlgR family response regulator